MGRALRKSQEPQNRSTAETGTNHKGTARPEPGGPFSAVWKGRARKRYLSESASSTALNASEGRMTAEAFASSGRK